MFFEVSKYTHGIGITYLLTSFIHPSIKKSETIACLFNYLQIYGLNSLKSRFNSVMLSNLRREFMQS
jgi:hypothetical protein